LAEDRGITHRVDQREDDGEQAGFVAVGGKREFLNDVAKLGDAQKLDGAPKMLEIVGKKDWAIGDRAKYGGNKRWRRGRGWRVRKAVGEGRGM
jgi:hypothetical protein